MTEPTDIAGLMALVDQLVEHAREDDSMCYDQAPSQRFQDARDELQEVLAKWGTPAPVGVEPVAWAATSEDGDVEALGMNQSRRFDTPLYTAPPVLAMRREPLTRDQVKAILVESGYYNADAQHKSHFMNGIRHGEAAHGIKQGGQHGTE